MTPQGSPASQNGSGTVTVATVASAVAGLLAIIASFLPFASAGGISQNVWHRVHFMSLVFFFLAIVGACGIGVATRLRPSNAMVRVGSFTLFQVARVLAWTGLVAGIVSLIVIPGLGNAMFGISVSIGAGVWLGLVAAIVAVVVESFGSKIPFLNQALASAGPAAQAGWVAVAATVTATDDTGGTLTVEPGQWLQSLGTDPSGAPVIVLNGRQYRLPVGTPLHTSN